MQVKRLFDYIQKIESKFKLDLVYFSQNGIFLIFGQIISVILTLFLTWVLTTFLTKEHYGEFRFIITISTLLGLFALPGAYVALVRSVARGKSGVMSKILHERFKWSLIGLVVGLFLALAYFIKGDYELVFILFIVAIATPMIYPLEIHNAYLTGLGNFRVQVILDIFKRALIVGTLVIGIFYVKNILLLIALFLTSNWLANILILKYIFKKYPTSPSTEIDDAEVTAYARHLSFMAALKNGADNLDKVIVWYFAGPVQLAHYVIAVAFPREIQISLWKLAQIMLFKMSSQDDEDSLYRQLPKKLLMFFILGVSAAVFYFLISPVLFVKFFPSYLDVIHYSQLAAALLLTAPAILLTQYFYVLKKTRSLYFIQIFEPMCFLGLLFLLVPWYGVYGAILALLGRFFLSFVLQLTILLFMSKYRV